LEEEELVADPAPAELEELEDPEPDPELLLLEPVVDRVVLPWVVVMVEPPEVIVETKAEVETAEPEPPPAAAPLLLE